MGAIGSYIEGLPAVNPDCEEDFFSQLLERTPEDLRKLADHGDSYGQLAYGVCLRDGKGVEKNLEQAAQYFKKSADQGNPYGQRAYGSCLRDGKGVEENLEQAAKYLKKSADQGNSNAQNEYAHCLAEGKGVEQNRKQAAKYFKKSVDQGNFMGQLAYASFLKEGEGAEENPEQVAKYLKKWADQGSSYWQREYGKRLRDGNGVKQNLEQAAKYFKRSADQGYAYGQRTYGKCLENGEGVERNLEQAAEYYQQAVDHGYKRARSDLARVLVEDRKARPCFSDWIIDDSHLTVVRSIGRGSYGTVELVHDETRGGELAVKTLNMVDGDRTKEFLRETETLIMICHPCVLSIKGIVLPTPESGPKIVTEFVPNGSLADVLRRVAESKPVDFWTHTNIAVIVLGIVCGMRYIHSRGVMHRDLKPANILIDHDFHPCICDFGCSRLEDAEVTQTHDIGTPLYTAPEMYDGGMYTTQVDVFSFGLILYEIIFGKRVFSGNLTKLAIFKKCVMGERPRLDQDDLPDGVHESVLDIISRSWSVDPSQRPTFDDILETLRSIDFMIFSDVDSRAVTLYKDSIEEWESGKPSKDDCQIL